MKCPRCGTPDMGVVDSRPTGADTAVRRRRKCLGCGERITTLETAMAEHVRAVRADARGAEIFALVDLLDAEDADVLLRLGRRLAGSDSIALPMYRRQLLEADA